MAGAVPEVTGAAGIGAPGRDGTRVGRGAVGAVGGKPLGVIPGAGGRVAAAGVAVAGPGIPEGAAGFTGATAGAAGRIGRLEAVAFAALSASAAAS